MTWLEKSPAGRKSDRTAKHNGLHSMHIEVENSLNLSFAAMISSSVILLLFIITAVFLGANLDGQLSVVAFSDAAAAVVVVVLIIAVDRVTSVVQQQVSLRPSSNDPPTGCN